jgi:hypothetical protein
MRSWRILLLGSALVAVALVLLSFGLRSAHDASANPLGSLVSISAGEGQSCAITNGGGVQCWGQADLLGASPPSTNIPVDVAGLASGVTQISAGLTHTCAVTQTGGLKCWGGTFGGAAVDVAGLSSGVAQVDVGSGRTCVVTTAGAATCWGSNSYPGDQPSPTVVQGLESGVASVDVGIEHTCAVMSSGSVKCWGANQHGELGDGTTNDRYSPVDVAGLSGTVAVAVGLNHTCVLTDAGGVKCWGYHYRMAPADVPGVSSGVAAISALYNHTCALTTAGGVKCWGANDYGQLGDGYSCGIACASPTSVTGLSSGVTRIAVGVNHSCAVKDNGSAKCWGNNFIGQLGDGAGGVGNVSPLPADVVEQNAKQSPCPTEGCPTPPQRPVLRDGLDFSIGIDTNGDGMEDCGTRDGQSPECTVPSGASVDVMIDINSLPAGLSGFAGVDLVINDAALRVLDSRYEFVWPDCVSYASNRGHPDNGHPDNLVAFGCSGSGRFDSTYSGPMLKVPATCSQSGSVTLLHGQGYTDAIDNDVRAYYERTSGSETVDITCGSKIAGDTDCNTSVNSLDAVLTLQRSATLVDHVACAQQADVNMDNRADAVDAALTLQYTVGLLDSLPRVPQN